MNKHAQAHAEDGQDDGPLEIAIFGDLLENHGALAEKLLDVPHGGECVLYFDSPGGSAYSAIALASLIRLRGIKATGIVVGECTSAALWPFAACERRLVTRFSVLLFHPMKWQSEEAVVRGEAVEWARHFGQLESQMDELLADLFGAPPDLIAQWCSPGRYVTGIELAEAGLADLIELSDLSRPDE